MDTIEHFVYKNQQQKYKMYRKTLKDNHSNFFEITSNTIGLAIDKSTLNLHIFEKKRVLKKSTDKFPIPRSFFKQPIWEADELQSIKTYLNDTKSEIDSCNLDTWHTHTKRMDVAGKIIPTMRKKIKPEYGSQAWCKFFECLNTYPVIPEYITKQQKSCVPFYSVHLCEAPGGFISATNHFIKNRYPYLTWNWLGTTLNPHYEGNNVGSMINEDKLILNSLNNWTFLQDSTGNIISEVNINYLIEYVENKFKTSDGQSQKVSLVTADGSIDCQANPMNQEAMVAELQFAEIVAALFILGDGGTLVLKMFTFLECKAISYLYLLCSLFKEVHLFKPATSKEGNSEVYVVCLNYCGKSCFLKELMQLKKNIGDKRPMYSLVSKNTALDGTFYDRLKDAAKFFTGHQIAVINRNIDTYRKKDLYFSTDIVRDEVLKTWMNKFQAEKLFPAQQLFGRLNYRRVAHVDIRKEVGTFLDTKKRTADVFFKLIYIMKELSYYKNYCQTKWNCAEIYGEKKQFETQKGKPYENIMSSRFCFGKLLLKRQELRNAVKQLAPIFNNTVFSSHKRCSNHQLLLQGLCQSLNLMETASKNENWTLHQLCFYETPQNLLFTKDINQTQVGLYNLMCRLGEIKKGDALFLCEFPLLTRLHVGVIYMLSTVFEKAIVYLDTSTNTRGIVLYNFLGFIFEVDSEWTIQIANILDDIQKNKNSVALQVVPTKVLVEMTSYDRIFEYNLFNTAATLEDMITEIKTTFWNI